MRVWALAALIAWALPGALRAAPPVLSTDFSSFPNQAAVTATGWQYKGTGTTGFATFGGSNVITSAGPAWVSPNFTVTPNSYYRITYTYQSPTFKSFIGIFGANPSTTYDLEPVASPIYWAGKTGQLLHDDYTGLRKTSGSYVTTSSIWQAPQNASYGFIIFQNSYEAPGTFVSIKSVSVTPVTKNEALGFADTIRASFAASPAVILPADRTTRLPQTFNRLSTGQNLKIAFIGDSTVCDTINSLFTARVERSYPGASITLFSAIGHGTGTGNWWKQYKAPEAPNAGNWQNSGLDLQKAVFDRSPNLVVIGGISNEFPNPLPGPAELSNNYTATKNLIDEIRLKNPGTEILLTTGALGNWDPVAPTFVRNIDSLPASDYRRRLRDVAAEKNVAFFDLGGEWGQYMLDEYAAERVLNPSLTTTAYYDLLHRDAIHGNDFGKDSVGAVFEAYFSIAQPFASTDIGSPGVAGRAAYDGTTHTVTGGGADIWGTSDQFHYASDPATGDGTLIAKITSMSGNETWAKAGVMFRDSLAANSAFVMMVATPGAGVSLQRRASTGSQCDMIHVPGVARPTPAQPVWVRLGKTGSSFTGSYSFNGTTWNLVGTTHVTFTNTDFRDGLAVTSHNNATSTQVTLTNVSYDGGAPGVGIVGEYFNNRTLNGAPTLTRTDATVNFDWAAGSPGAGLPADQFSVRWTGRIQALGAGSYTFATMSDDGVRLWIDGALVINNWTDHGVVTDTSSAIALSAGQEVAVKMEFYENGGGAMAKLLWTPPGSGQQIIPQRQLYPPSLLTPIETWLMSKFGAHANNPAISGGEMDPDFDGMKNLIEYFLGLNPLLSDLAGSPVGGKLNDHLTLGFTRVKAATDVSFRVEVTGGLGGSWQSGPGFTELMTTTDLGATETLLYRDVQTISGKPTRFIRLKVTRP